MRRWAYLAGAIGFEVLGTMALRASVDQPGWIPVTVLGYAVSLVMLGLTLRERMPIGVAYGIWSAVGVALVAVLGVVVFGEQLGPVRVAGIAVVIVGVVLVETGSHPAQSGPHPGPSGRALEEGS